MQRLIGGARRVERDDYGADRDEREVGERPLEARAAQDGDAVALPDSEREKTRGELVHAAAGLVPRDLAPAPALAHEVRGRHRRAGEGALPDLGDGCHGKGPGLRRRNHALLL